jgi:hypothetical protein
MKKTILGIAFCCSITVFASSEDDLKAQIPGVFDRIEKQMKILCDVNEKAPKGKFARDWDDKKKAYSFTSMTDWVSGFTPGVLWYLYEYTKKDEWKEKAIAETQKRECIRNYTGNHDIGFMLYCSAGNALRITGDSKYKEWLHDAAKALSTRYNDKLGLIRSWNSPGKGKNYFTPQYIVIVDNMMNLELLEWDSKNGGSPKSAVIAKSHADLTDKNHFREDGSAYHILDYNPENGLVRGMFAGQGANARGTWSRGQAWAIYGYTMMYRETKDKLYLARAVKAADYWLNAKNTPEDAIPYWDYSAANIPNEERDASAAAITASALIELEKYAPGKGYRQRAVKMLLSLSSPAYLAEEGSNGGFILRHSVGAKSVNSQVDVALTYADYYYIEALMRFIGK